VTRLKGQLCRNFRGKKRQVAQKVLTVVGVNVDYKEIKVSIDLFYEREFAGKPDQMESP
jgi:hypothetical protein